MRRAVPIWILAAFTALSAVFLRPRAGTLSTLLTVRETADTEVPEAFQALAEKLLPDGTMFSLERSDYTDSRGHVTYATEKRYATVIRAVSEGRVLLEAYYDEHGRPAVSFEGFHAKCLHYDAEGLNDCTVTYDEEGEECPANSGCSRTFHTYDELGRVLLDTYGLFGEPAAHADGFWQYERLYEDGDLPACVRTLDREGEPVNNRNGIGIAHRTYNAQGLKERETWEDRDGRPVPGSLGEYGTYREYDAQGRETYIAYLGKDGKPAATTRGFAAIRKSYPEAGETSMYFDADDRPVCLEKRDYGMQNTGTMAYALDEQGRRILRPDTVLAQNPWLVLLGGFVLALGAGRLSVRGGKAAALAALLVIPVMTLAFREANGNFGITWFDGWRRFFYDSTVRREIIYNIWLFVPLGALFGRLGKKHPRVLLLLLAGSILIELLQLVTHLGHCEADDVLSNSLGGLIGWLSAAPEEDQTQQPATVLEDQL